MPYESIPIASWSMRGKEAVTFKPESRFGIGLLIRNSVGNTLKKDYLQVSNWDFNLSERRVTISYEYTLELGPENS